MEHQENTFYCPYCGNAKEKSKLHYKSEIRNLNLSSTEKEKINKMCAHKHLIFNFTKYKVPICNDCLSLLLEAHRKAVLSAFAFFIPFAVLLCYLLIGNGSVGLFFSLFGLLGVVSLAIWWYVKTNVLIKKGGVYSSESNGYKKTYGVLEPFSKLCWGTE